MAGQKTISTTYKEPIPPPAPPPVPDYVVTDSIFPSINGNYFAAGNYGGKPYYAKNVDNSFLWWDIPATRWVLSLLLSNPGSGYFKRTDQSPIGVYITIGDAVGVVYVNAGV